MNSFVRMTAMLTHVKNMLFSQFSTLVYCFLHSLLMVYLGLSPSFQSVINWIHRKAILYACQVNVEISSF